jgi:hypothetical protein
MNPSQVSYSNTDSKFTSDLHALLNSPIIDLTPARSLSVIKRKEFTLLATFPQCAPTSQAFLLDVPGYFEKTARDSSGVMSSLTGLEMKMQKQDLEDAHKDQKNEVGIKFTYTMFLHGTVPLANADCRCAHDSIRQ